MSTDLYNGITINGKHSYDDFELYLKSKSLPLPERKNVRVTVPYMNGSHDFSAINGQIYYEDRELSYTFDVIGINAAAMETVKQQVAKWLMGATDVSIYDDDIPGYHFRGSLSETEWSEEDGQGELTVVFKAYPFKISDGETTETYGVVDQQEVTITNGGDHPVRPTITVTDTATIEKGGESYIFGTAGTYQTIVLDEGENTLVITSSESVTISFRTEVF